LTSANLINSNSLTVKT